MLQRILWPLFVSGPDWLGAVSEVSKADDLMFLVANINAMQRFYVGTLNFATF